MHTKEVDDDSDLLFRRSGILGRARPTPPSERERHQGHFSFRRTFSERLLQEVVLGLQLDNEVAAIQVLLVLLQMSGETKE